jgi:hypothetical protein
MSFSTASSAKWPKIALKGDLPRAKEYAMRALAADPKNPMALKNLGAILGKEGNTKTTVLFRDI